MTTPISMGVPWIDAADVRAVTAVLRSGNLALGSQAEAFERGVAAYCGTRYCVGVGSGTEALHLALKAIGVVPGDEVIIPSVGLLALA